MTKRERIEANRVDAILSQRKIEDAIVDSNPGSEIAQSILDHRAAGNYTTLGNV